MNKFIRLILALTTSLLVISSIFKRFYRVDKASSRHEGGTGIGLAIVKHIIQYHKGKIDVQSTKEEGSTFTISIPNKLKL
jgi:two-component system phosphate regulon sensor histidine kinase PhoR